MYYKVTTHLSSPLITGIQYDRAVLTTQLLPRSAVIEVCSTPLYPPIGCDAPLFPCCCAAECVWLLTRLLYVSRGSTLASFQRRAEHKLPKPAKHRSGAIIAHPWLRCACGTHALSCVCDVSLILLGSCPRGIGTPVGHNLSCACHSVSRGAVRRVEVVP